MKGEKEGKKSGTRKERRRRDKRREGFLFMDSITLSCWRLYTLYFLAFHRGRENYRSPDYDNGNAR